MEREVCKRKVDFTPGGKATESRQIKFVHDEDIKALLIYQVRRSVTKLFKSHLTNIEDIQQEHQSSLKKVEGLVGIKVSRLLRIDLDFVYNNAEEQVRLKESRNIKLEELNYFDHPLFGILVLVSPVEIEEPNS